MVVGTFTHHTLTIASALVLEGIQPEQTLFSRNFRISLFSPPRCPPCALCTDSPVEEESSGSNSVAGLLRSIY